MRYRNSIVYRFISLILLISFLSNVCYCENFSYKSNTKNLISTSANLLNSNTLAPASQYMLENSGIDTNFAPSNIKLGLPKKKTAEEKAYRKYQYKKLAEGFVSVINYIKGFAYISYQTVINPLSNLLTISGYKKLYSKLLVSFVLGLSIFQLNVNFNTTANAVEFVSQAYAEELTSPIANFYSPLGYQFRVSQNTIYAEFPFLDTTDTTAYLPADLYGSYFIAGLDQDDTAIGLMAKFDALKDLKVYKFCDVNIVNTQLVDLLKAQGFHQIGIVVPIRNADGSLSDTQGFVKTFKKGDKVELYKDYYDNPYHSLNYVMESKPSFLLEPIGGAVFSPKPLTQDAATRTDRTQTLSYPTQYTISFGDNNLIGHSYLLSNEQGKKTASVTAPQAKITFLKDSWLIANVDSALYDQNRGIVPVLINDGYTLATGEKGVVIEPQGPYGVENYKSLQKFYPEGSTYTIMGNGGYSGDSNSFYIVEQVQYLIDGVTVYQGNQEDWDLSNFSYYAKEYMNRTYKITGFSSNLSGVEILVGPNVKDLSGKILDIKGNQNKSIEAIWFLDDRLAGQVDIPEGFVPASEYWFMADHTPYGENIKYSGHKRVINPNEILSLDGLYTTSGSAPILAFKELPGLMNDINIFDTNASQYDFGVFNSKKLYSNRGSDVSDPIIASYGNYELVSWPTFLDSNKSVWTIRMPYKKDGNPAQDRLNFKVTKPTRVYLAIDASIADYNMPQFIWQEGFTEIPYTTELLKVKEGNWGVKSKRIFYIDLSQGEALNLKYNTTNFPDMFMFAQEKDVAAPAVFSTDNVRLEFRIIGTSVYTDIIDIASGKVLKTNINDLSEINAGEFVISNDQGFAPQNTGLYYIGFSWDGGTSTPPWWPAGTNLTIQVALGNVPSANDPIYTSLFSVCGIAPDANSGAWEGYMTLPVGSNTFVAHVTEPLYGMESAKSDPYYHTIAESNVFSIVNKLTNETIYISYNPDTMTTTILPRQNFPSDPLTNFAEQSLMAKVPFSYFDDGKAAVSKQEIFNDPINSFIGKSVKNEKASGITDELGVLLDVFRLHRNVLRSLEKFNKSNNKEFNYYTRLFNPLNELKNKYFILAEGADEFARTSAEKEIILFKRALEKRKGEAFDMRAARALFVIWHESDTQGPESHDFVIPRDIKRLEYLEREFKVDIKQLLSVTGMEYYKKIWESKNFHYQMQKMFQGENRLYKIHKGNVKNSDIPAVVVMKANQILNNRSDLITDIGYHLRHSDVNKNKLVIQITSDITDAKKAPEVVEKIAKMLKDEGVPQSAYEFRYDSTESIAGILNYKNIPLNRITILFDEGEVLNQEILNSKVNKLRYSPIKPCQMVLAVYFAKTGKIDFDKVPPEENSREKMDKKDKNKIKKPEKPVYAFLKEFLRKNPDGSYSFFDKVTGPNPYGPMNRSA